MKTLFPTKHKITIGVVAVLILCITVGVLAQKSNPGDMFYGLKIFVSEKLFSVVQVTEEQQFNYGIGLLENRLEELKVAAVSDELTDERLAVFEEQYESHVSKIDELLNSESNAFNAREIFDTTNHMVAMIRASDEIINYSNEAGTSDRFDAVHDTALAIHQNQMDRIVSESTPEEMIAIIQENLARTAGLLETQNQYTKNTVSEYLIDTSMALNAQDFGGALESIGSAVQFLEVQSQVSQTQG